MSKYKYTTTFAARIFASSDIPKLEEQCKESLASMEDIAPSCGENIDLLAVAFDGAVINQFNANDDGIGAATAVAMKDRFRHKPINIEHDRSRIIGHITNAVFTDRSSKEFIWSDEAAAIKHPFNLTLGGFVYKMVNADFYEDLMESMDSSSPFYEEYSASWEVGFNTFGVAIGSEELQYCEVITNPIEVAKYAENLRCFGGDGFTEDGRRVRRLIMGDVYPLGMGFVRKPAADVKGIKGFDGDAKCDKTEKAAAKNEDFIANQGPDISQCEKSNVKSPDQKIISMDLLEQLKEALANQEKVTEEVAANITKQFSDLIRQSDEKYRQQIEEKENAIQAEKDKQVALEEAVAELKTKLEATESRLKEFEEAQAQEALENARNQRMEHLDSLYQLDDEDRKVIFQDLAGIDVTSDEEFEAYANKLAVILRHKTKEAVAAAEAAAQEAKEIEEAKASQEEEATKTEEEAVAEASEAEKPEVPNNNGGDGDIVNRWGNAFNKENTKIEN